MLGSDVRLFKDTPVWEVAKSIEANDTSGIREFFSESNELLEFTESRYGKTLLNWSVYASHYPGSVALCKLGADPNKPANDGRTALIYAASNYDTSDFLALLLKHQGDPNYIVDKKEQSIDATPLIAASSVSLENTKLLVESGADVNYVWGENVWQNDALSAAFKGGKMEIIHYLILHAGADFDKPLSQTMDGTPIYIAEKLRNLPFDLDSRDFELKMEVVAFLERHEIDYRGTPIPKRFYELYSEEYLKRY